MRKLKSQLEQVDTALARARVRRGLISAGYNQGSGNHVAPKKAIEYQNHRQALTNSSPKEELSTTCSLDDEPGYSCEDGVDDHVYASEQQGQIVGYTDRGLEENGKVVDDCIATSKLLEEL